MKKLMLGNEAVARGLYEAGCRYVSSYPGTPSTEITEAAAEYPEIYAEWAPNEKVAAESAFGAAVEGARSFTGMKHVGLNVATDLVFTASYTGINGGMIIAVADDQGMHSSQNEQDSRHYAVSAKMPMLEPCDSGECIDYVKLAYELSEEYDTPVFLRLSTRISHSQSLVELKDRVEVPVRPYEKNIQKYVMSPANAMRRHPIVEERTRRLTALANTDKINKVIPGSKKIGVIAAGIAYDYAKEALGENASYLKLGMLYPLPTDLIRDFAASVEKLYVIEELDPIIETHVRAMGIACQGKELFSLIGEYTVADIREKLLGVKSASVYAAEDVPVRPPVLCPGCPHRGLFYVLNKLKLSVSGDIGCYTLGSSAPLSAMDTTIDMGASISMLHGRIKARPEAAKTTVAVIGDSTFIHSGLTGLVNITYNNSPATVIIADNSITGMTGHQPNPATGVTLKDQVTNAVNLEEAVRACGVRRVRVVDPYETAELEKILREELAAEEPSVVITRRPCALLKTVKRNRPLSIDPDKCRRCRMCMKIGCPAISFEKGYAAIDSSLCVGCGLCRSLCKFDAIG
ncbi:MAG: indolepyruvate ferredoxin oxidoreductase subunit alpha [Ruminococcaceae bacterium]|nr:indolepyruvate ferredoxin oxidoreductase subunit alpha [Oscillospiraceae bacterium]